MFLKKLSIHKDSTLIREIKFHKGLNLIVDETKTDNIKESGNNVGKTTVLRLVDYCLGSKGTNIYKDPEFKSKSNTLIEKFLKDNNIIITMILTDDLNSIDSSEIEIRRNFLSYSQKIQEVNGEQLSNDEFPEKLKKLIFNSVFKKPTLRQIVSRNIRDEKNKLTNTLKVLHPTTKNLEYEAVYLYWLGIEVDKNAKKQQLAREEKIEENFIKGLRREATIDQIV